MDDNCSVGEIYFINDIIDGMVFTSCSEYADLFNGICEGLRIGWKAAKGELSDSGPIGCNGVLVGG